MSVGQFTLAQEMECEQLAGNEQLRNDPLALSLFVSLSPSGLWMTSLGKNPHSSYEVSQSDVSQVLVIATCADKLGCSEQQEEKHNAP